MGNSASKRKIKHSRSKSDFKTQNNKPIYRQCSQPTGDINKNEINQSEKTKNEHTHRNVRRIVSLNDKPKKIHIKDIPIPRPHSLNTPQISSSLHNDNHSNSNTPQSSIDISNIGTLTTNTAMDTPNHTAQESDSSILNHHYRSHTHTKTFSNPKQYSQRTHHSPQTTLNTITITYPSTKKEENKAQIPTHDLPDPSDIEDFGFEDDEAYNAYESVNKYLHSPSMEPEPIPKSVRSIHSIRSIPLSAISKMSVSDNDINPEMEMVSTTENESSQSSSSQSLLQRADDTTHLRTKPIQFTHYYSEPNNELVDYSHTPTVNINKSETLTPNTSLLKVRSTPNLQSLNAFSKSVNVTTNNNNVLNVINDASINSNSNCHSMSPMHLNFNNGSIEFVDDSEDSDCEIKKDTKYANALTPPPTLGQSQSLNIKPYMTSSNMLCINDKNSPTSLSSASAAIFSPTMPSLKEISQSQKLGLFRSVSDPVTQQTNIPFYDQKYNKNNQRRKYRSKYGGHYKISLSGKGKGNNTNKNKYKKQRAYSHNNYENKGKTVLKRRNRSNSESLNENEARFNNNTKKDKKRVKKRRKRKAKSEKYKVRNGKREKYKKKGIMSHFRSRSHSLANIKLKLDNNSTNKDGNEYIRYKCTEKSKKHLRNDKLRNGVIGIYITETFAINAYRFWKENITVLTEREFREASTLFFSHLMVNVSKLCSDITSKYLMRNNDIIAAPLKYFDMIGWLLRVLVNDTINAYHTLKEIGKIHFKQYNTSIASYYAMLNSVHIIFKELFAKEYNLRLKYTFDIVFISVAFIMNGNLMDSDSNINNDCLLKQRYTTLNSLYFLQSLDVCLLDEIGSEYLYHFLHQSYCSEIPKFLMLYGTFKHCNPSNHRLKYKISHRIYKECIADTSQFQINVPFATYQQIKCAINEIDRQNENDAMNLNVENDMFDVAYKQVKRLIQQNHWTNFKNTLQMACKEGQIGV